LRRLGTILILGAIAGYGVRYVTSRASSPSTRAPRTLIDWETARRIALRVSQSSEHAVADRALRQQQYMRLVERSEPLIARYMGAGLAAPINRVYVFDRREWLEANFESFRRLIEPIEQLYSEAGQHTVLASALAGLNRQMVGVQVGVLLGYIARRVLGQYDLSLLSPDPQVRGALYFIEPNIARTQALLGVSDEEFRLWIALHETSHVFEFEAFPWVRGYFHELLGQFLGQMSNQLSILSGGLGQLIDRILSGRGAGKHWIETLMTPDQQRIFDKLQALMSLVEGYSNHIMNAIGGELLPSFHQIEERVNARQRSRPLVEELFNRVTGMDLKLAQYKQGEAFINTVVAQRGIAYANRVWERPEHLPSMQELRSPELWIRRMEQGPAAE
jgi:coenzyme F420 biosynthesis associated uncharacterized protein